MNFHSSGFIVVGDGHPTAVSDQVIFDKVGLVCHVMPSTDTCYATVVDMATADNVPALAIAAGKPPPLATKVNTNGIGITDFAVLYNPMMSCGSAQCPTLGWWNRHRIGSMINAIITPRQCQNSDIIYLSITFFYGHICCYLTSIM